MSKQINVSQHIARLMPAWDTARVREVDYMTGGYSNANFAFTYDGARYVLRVPQVPQPFVDRHHERAWYDVLPRSIGVRPLALDTRSGCMLTPWVEGRLLVDVWPELTLEELAAYLRTLHAGLPEEMRLYDLHTINEAFWQEEQPPHTPAHAQTKHLQVCHNDLNPWNILLTDAGWVTLDWEFVGRNDPLFDVVALYLGLELPATELHAFARLYADADSGELNGRLAAARHAFWVRELGWARFQLAAGNDRDEIREQLATAQRELEAGPP